MNLGQLRTETLNHGFDQNAYGGRVTQYLNDAQSLIARRVDFYQDETTQVFSTVAGTDVYPWPVDFARMRSLMNTTSGAELQFAAIRDVDRAGPASGTPAYYALYGGNVQLYPKPDGIYSVTLRYWRLPAAMVADTDVPAVPADWSHLLWVYATWMCFEADDDPQMGQFWQARFNTELSQFASDQKFPDTDSAQQVRGMWDGGGLNTAGWTLG